MADRLLASCRLPPSLEAFTSALRSPSTFADRARNQTSARRMNWTAFAAATFGLKWPRLAVSVSATTFGRVVFIISA